MISVVKEWAIQVPARAQAGQRLRIREAGMAGRHGGAPGDCFVALEVGDHPHLSHRDDDLLVTCPIPLPRALAGGWMLVPSLESSARIRVPAGSVHGDVLRMKGYGLPRSGGRRGDQLVTLSVEMPDALSEDEARSLTSLLDEGQERFPESARFDTELSEDEGES
jgi:molecular chaperone DnaJ